MPLQDITITGSIGSIATQSYGQRTYISSTDEQSFPIESITGSQAGAWPNFEPGTNYTVDLIVNVTQSWSGSNTTPLGIIPYIHNTMEEFIDGEFSGSNYVVSDGSLNDAQCEQFLTVNTTTISYSMFPYATSYTDGVVNGSTSSLDTFLNKNTIPYNGQFLMHYNVDLNTEVAPTTETYTIDYIKVARFDQEGNDNTLSLQELTNFIWTDSEVTVGEIVLTVENITEYPTYYLYKVNSREWVDIPYYADDNVLNYAFSASSADTSASAGLNYISNWNVINNASGQIGGAFYQFANTPNCNITYSASITATNYNAVPISFSFGFWSTSDFNYFTPVKTSSLITIPAGNNQTVALNGIASYQFLGETSYWLETKNLNAPVSLSNVFWIMTQSQSPQTATSSVVIEPYLLSTFRNSDCDILINNASENDISQTHQRVLYENGGNVPSNLQQIISGTAEYAEVNDYLYNAHANARPRYEGVRTTSANFNLPSQVGFSNTELSEISTEENFISIDNGIPNVANLQTYFAYFDYMIDTSYELINKSAAHIIYLIDKDGDIQTPTLTGSYYYNLIDNFVTNDKSNVIVEDINGSKIFIGNKNVIRAGVIPRAILYSQTGSGYNIQDPLNFGDNSVTNTSPPDYSSKFQVPLVGQDITGNSTSANQILKLDFTPVPSPNITLSPGTDALTINTSTNLASIILTINFSYYVYNVNGKNRPTLNMNVSLEESLDGSTWTPIQIIPYSFRRNPLGGGFLASLSANTTYTSDLSFSSFVPVSTNRYRIRLSTGDGYLGLHINPATTITVSQYPPLTTATVSLLSGSYWETGSTNKNVINSTQFLPLYTPVNPITQRYDPNAGYSPSLPFVIYPNDQIRFEGDESQTYTITEVDPNPVYLDAFDTDFGTWYKSNAAIDLGSLATTNTASFFGVSTNTYYISQSLTTPLNNGETYYLELSVTEYDSGDLSLYVAGINYDGIYTFQQVGSLFLPIYGSPMSSQEITFISDNFSGSISTVSIYSQLGLKLTLDQNITPGTDVNSFLIRRFQPHPNYVILDSTAISGSGYLLPEYSTNELKQNFDNIIVSLRERTLI